MQGADWMRKFDSTPPTPPISVLPEADGFRDWEEGRMGSGGGRLCVCVREQRGRRGKVEREG